MQHFVDRLSTGLQRVFNADAGLPDQMATRREPTRLSPTNTHNHYFCACQDCQQLQKMLNICYYTAHRVIYSRQGQDSPMKLTNVAEPQDDKHHKYQCKCAECVVFGKILNAFSHQESQSLSRLEGK